jgi:hypothetical protein
MASNCVPQVEPVEANFGADSSGDNACGSATHGKEFLRVIRVSSVRMGCSAVRR